jgi:hypothetical protein
VTSPSELQQAACYRPEVPPSILLSAREIQTGRSDSLRFSLVISADSPNFISLAGQLRQLDFGVCTFDAEGQLLQYMNASAEQVLTPEKFQLSLR